MNNLFDISSEERNRIMNLHEGATKRQYLTLEQAPQPIITKTTKSSSDTVFPKQNLQNQFKFGEYQSDNAKNFITGLKPKIEEFIKNMFAKVANAPKEIQASVLTQLFGIHHGGKTSQLAANMGLVYRMMQDMGDTSFVNQIVNQKN